MTEYTSIAGHDLIIEYNKYYDVGVRDEYGREEVLTNRVVTAIYLEYKETKREISFFVNKNKNLKSELQERFFYLDFDNIK